jgi:hypothetical protein
MEILNSMKQQGPTVCQALCYARVDKLNAHNEPVTWEPLVLLTGCLATTLTRQAIEPELLPYGRNPPRVRALACSILQNQG